MTGPTTFILVSLICTSLVATIYISTFFAIINFMFKKVSHNNGTKNSFKRDNSQVFSLKSLITDTGSKKLDNILRGFVANQDVKEKGVEFKKNNIRQNNDSLYMFDGANPKDVFYKKFNGMSPEEVLELNKAANDKFSHDIYHESNNTVHNSNGVYFVYDQTEQTYYWGESTNILKLVCKLLKTSGNPIYKAYKQGNSLRIKLLVPDGNVFRSNKEIIDDLRNRYLK